MFFLRFILFACLLTGVLYAQAPEGVSETTLDFINELDSYYIEYQKNKNAADNYTKEEVMVLARKFYKMMAEDPQGYRKIVFQSGENRKKEYHKTGIVLPKIGVKIRAFRELVEHFTDKYYFYIIKPSYYVRAKVLSIKKEPYFSKVNPWIKLTKIVMKIEITEVVKGKQVFQKGRTEEISLLGFWYEDCKRFFQQGVEYFIPIELWGCDKGKCNASAPASSFNGVYAIFPIENEIISNVDVFGCGTQMNWDDFKLVFQSKYILESGGE